MDETEAEIITTELSTTDLVNNNCSKICATDKIENYRLACKIPEDDNAKDLFNDFVNNILASFKVSEIDDAHGAHSMVSNGVVKSENESCNALTKNNLQKCNLDSSPVVVSYVKNSIDACASTYVPIKTNLLAGNAISRPRRASQNPIIRDQMSFRLI